MDIVSDNFKKPITIGMVGGVAPILANNTLSEVLDQCITHHRCNDDQQHPEYINISISTNGKFDTLVSFVKNLVAAQVDVIVLPAYFSQAEIDKLAREAGTKEIPIITTSKSVTSINEIPKASKKLATEIVRSVQHLESFSKNISATSVEVKRASLSIQKDNAIKSKFIGVIGGGGVEAGLDCSKQLVERNVPHVLYSMSAAPDKNNAVLGTGKSFVEDYKYAVQFFKDLSGNNTDLRVAIPCNTAHAFAPQIFGDEQKNLLLDIRQSTADLIANNFCNETQIILLGTPATIAKRIYDPFFDPTKVKLIIPNEPETEDTKVAIYDIKKGYHKLTQNEINKKEKPGYLLPQDRILKVLSGIKERNNLPEDTKAILGCTELGLPFGPEMNFSNINTVLALAEKCNSHIHSYLERNTSSSSGTDLEKTTSSEEDKPAPPDIKPSTFNDVCLKFKISPNDFSYSQDKHGTIRIYIPKIIEDSFDGDKPMKALVKDNTDRSIDLRRQLLVDVNDLLSSKFSSPSRKHASNEPHITYLGSRENISQIKNFLDAEHIQERQKEKSRTSSENSSPQRREFVVGSLSRS